MFFYQKKGRDETKMFEKLDSKNLRASQKRCCIVSTCMSVLLKSLNMIISNQI